MWSCFLSRSAVLFSRMYSKISFPSLLLWFVLPEDMYLYRMFSLFLSSFILFVFVHLSLIKDLVLSISRSPLFIFMFCSRSLSCICYDCASVSIPTLARSFQPLCSFLSLITVLCYVLNLSAYSCATGLLFVLSR